MLEAIFVLLWSKDPKPNCSQEQ